MFAPVQVGIKKAKTSLESRALEISPNYSHLFGKIFFARLRCLIGTALISFFLFKSLELGNY